MTSLTPLDPLGGLDALVRGQHGVVSRDQALTTGLTTRQIEWRLTTGRWLRVHRTVYLTQPGREDRPMRTSAAVLACGDRAVLSHASAAVEHGLRTQEPSRIEVLIPHSRRVVEPDGVRVRHAREIETRVLSDTHLWPPRTTVEHTVLDLAAEGTADDAIALAALACQRGLTWDGRLLDVLATRTRHPWRDLLVSALGDIGAGAESTMEVRYVRDVERPHGLPTGRLQQPTRGGSRRHDVGYEAQKLLVELDGLAFHSSAAARIRDGRRDRGSLGEGWLSIRAFWSDVATTPCALAGEVAGLLSARGWDGSAHRCRRRACALGSG